MTPMIVLRECCGLHRRFSPLLIPAALALVCAAAAPAGAQALPGIALPAPSGSPLPSGVTQEGNWYSAPVALDGITLFRIAVRADADNAQLTLAARAAAIDGSLGELLTEREGGAGTIYDPKTLRVTTKAAGNATVIGASDAGHKAPFPILTVTAADSDYNGEPDDVLAAQWQSTLQTALVRELQKRQPAVRAQNVRRLAIIGAAFVAITILLILALFALRRRIDALATRVKSDVRAIDRAQSQSAAEQAPHERQRRRFLGIAVRAADPAIALAMMRAGHGILVWVLVLLWFAGIVWALSLFPQTTPIAATVYQRVTRIAFIWIAASLLMRVVAVAVAQIARMYCGHGGAEGEEHARRLLRVPTLVNTSVAIAAFVVYFVAVLSTLSQIGISTGSVLTLGGLVALAVSLAAQNLVRDFLNGFLVLVEDQYVVGDYVTIGDRSGLVERMTLRVVQLRDGAGNLVTIPHSQVNEVVNASRDWSRVDLRITVEPKADVGRATEIVRRTVADLARDPHWRTAEISAEWVGVDGISSAGIVLRASIKTAPLRQFEVKRELLTRTLLALRGAGIGLGSAA